jgi:hypothetical protein
VYQRRTTCTRFCGHPFYAFFGFSPCSTAISGQKRSQQTAHCLTAKAHLSADASEERAETDKNQLDLKIDFLHSSSCPDSTVVVQYSRAASHTAIKYQSVCRLSDDDAGARSSYLLTIQKDESSNAINSSSETEQNRTEQNRADQTKQKDSNYGTIYIY